MDNKHQTSFKLSPEKQALVKKLRQAQGKSRTVTPLIARSKTTSPIPLSFSQQRLWFLDQWEPESTTYHLTSAFRLQGPLDRVALESSFNDLLARHESLRTIFPTIEGEPVQVITPAERVLLPVLDLSTYSPAMQQTELQRLRDEDAKQPFDLTAGPLHRIQLLYFGSNEYILFVTLHHIITDGWSMVIMFQELSTLYSAHVTGQPATLPPLPIQYPDFAIWQRQWLQGDVLDRQLTYWRTQWAGAPPYLDFPTDAPRPSQQTYRGDRISFTLPPSLTQELKRLSQREGVTLFMILLAAFQILLARYTSQRDILVGTPIAGRTQTDLEGLIGFFVNTLVIRTQVKGQATFRDVLAQVRETCLDAYAHQDLPFEKLVEALQPMRDPSRHPLFQIMFQLHHADSTGELTLPTLKVVPLAPISQTAKFDLSLSMMETPSSLTGTFIYSTDLFESSTMTRFASHYEALVKNLIASPDQRVMDVPVLTEIERHQLLVEWNPPLVPAQSFTCVHHLFEAQVVRTPEAMAIVDKDEQLTYATLNERADQVARYLLRRGVRPEGRVGLCLERSVTMLVGVLGILKAGGTYVPIDPSTPSNRMRMIFTDARVGLVLTQLSYLQDFDSSQYATRSQTLPQWVAIDEPGFLTQSNPFSDVRPTVHPDNLAYIIYTSGSTGQPKGVGITQANFTQFVVSASIYLEVSPTDRILQFASLAFDAAIEEIFPCVISGSTLVLRTDKMIETIATFRDAVEQWQITVLDIPTAYWHELTAELSVQPFSMPGSIRLVVIGGEQARADQLVIWHQHTLPSLKLVNTYGPTEATVVTALENLLSSSILTNQEQFLPVTVGHPLENRTIYILDPYLHSTPIGVPGELYLGGQGLGRGYENLQKLTATAFIPDPFSDIPGTRLFRSGDRGRYLIDGRIELLGRMDRQVKIRGFRIELGDIETVLKQHPTVHEAVVLCREDHEAGDKQLAAYVIGAQQSPPSLLTLREFLRETLPIYMVPAIIVPLHEFPRLPSGKINRRALPAPDKASHVEDHTPIVPRTPMEDQVAKFWKELLNLSTIDVRDNFFDLGGHSLLATRLLSRIRMIFEIDLPLRLFFDYPTLEEQALAIEEHLLQAIEDLPEEFEDDLSGLSNPIDSISREEAKALLESDQKNENQ